MKKAKDIIFNWKINDDLDFIAGIRRIYDFCKTKGADNLNPENAKGTIECAMLVYNMILYAKNRTGMVVASKDIYPEPATKRQLQELLLVYNCRVYNNRSTHNGDRAEIVYDTVDNGKRPIFTISFYSSENKTSFIIYDLNIFKCFENTKLKADDLIKIYDSCIFRTDITIKAPCTEEVTVTREVTPEEEKRYLKRKAFRGIVDDIAYGTLVGTCSIAVASLGIVMIKGLVDMFRGEGGIEPSDIV